jgi:hypothetical protein
LQAESKIPCFLLVLGAVKATTEYKIQDNQLFSTGDEVRIALAIDNPREMRIHRMLDSNGFVQVQPGFVRFALIQVRPVKNPLLSQSVVVWGATAAYEIQDNRLFLTGDEVRIVLEIDNWP